MDAADSLADSRAGKSRPLYSAPLGLALSALYPLLFCLSGMCCSLQLPGQLSYMFFPVNVPEPCVAPPPLPLHRPLHGGVGVSDVSSFRTLALGVLDLLLLLTDSGCGGGGDITSVSLVMKHMDAGAMSNVGGAMWAEMSMSVLVVAA